MNTETLLIGALLIVAIIGGGVAFMSGVSDSYQMGTVDHSISADFETTQNISSEIADKLNKTANINADKGVGVYLLTPVADMVIIIRDLIFLPMTVLKMVLNGITNLFGFTLPSWFITFGFTLIGALGLFAFVRLVLGRT